MVLRRIRENTKFKMLKRVRKRPLTIAHSLDLFLVVVLLMSVPFSYLYHFFTKETRPFFYNFTTDFVTVVILVVWFITCRRWYYRYITIPLVVVFCRTCNVLANDKQVINHNLSYLSLAFLLLYSVFKLRQRWIQIEFYTYQEKMIHREALIFLLSVLRGGCKTYAKIYEKQSAANRLQDSKVDYFVLITLLSSIPISYVYMLFPSTKGFLFIHSEYFKDVSWFMYFFSQKFSSILLVFVWFITCRRWWWYVIAWPLLMYGFQMVSLISVEMGLIDVDKVFYLIPLALILIYPVYRARKFLYWDIFHEEWEKDKISLRETVRYVMRSLTEFIVLCLSMYLIQKILLEHTLPVAYFGMPQDPFVFQVLFVLLLLIWFLTAKDWWFFLLSFPLLFCTFNVMTSLGFPSAVSNDEVELYYLLFVLLLAVHPFYRLRYYIFESMYRDDVEKQRYIENVQKAVELLKRRNKS